MYSCKIDRIEIIHRFVATGAAARRSSANAFVQTRSIRETDALVCNKSGMFPLQPEMIPNSSISEVSAMSKISIFVYLCLCVWHYIYSYVLILFHMESLNVTRSKQRSRF